MDFYLRGPVFRKTMTNNAVMTLRASLNKAMFSCLYLSLPAYSEKKAGNFFYFLNQKVALNNRLNAGLETMGKILYEYCFVQFDFSDNNGKPYKNPGVKMQYNAVLKREIPEGWAGDKFGNIIFRSGFAVNPGDNFIPGKGDDYCVAIKNVNSGEIVLMKKVIRLMVLHQEL